MGQLPKVTRLSLSLSLVPRRTKTDVLSLRSFPTARSVFHHTCSNHVKYLTEYVCLWNGCERIRRQKWALISHIQVRAQDKSLSNRFLSFFFKEKHCSEVAFRQAKFKPTTNGPMMTTTTTTATNSSTAGYAPDAAWLAIRRHMQSSSFDDLTVISLKTNVFFFSIDFFAFFRSKPKKVH